MPNQIEETLAPLVYAQIQDQIPELFNYLIGFQLVDKQEEGKRCLGILAFNINNAHYYMPVFYANGFLKPLVIIFDYNKKMFKPATKKILDDLVKPKPGLDVENIPIDKFRQAISVPDLYQFSIPPMISKTGEKIELTREPIDFEKELKNFDKLAFLRILQDNKELLAKFATYHPLSCLHQEKKAQEELSKNEVVVMTEPSTDLSPEENQKIYNDKVIVKDNREVASKLIPKLVEDNVIWGPPLDNGLYEVITADGEFVKKWIWVHPTMVEKKSMGSDEIGDSDHEYKQPSDSAFLIDPKTLDCYEAHRNSVVARKLEPNLENLKEKMVGLKDIKEGKWYFLISQNLRDFVDGVQVSNNKSIIWRATPHQISINPHVSRVMDFIDKDLIISGDTLALPIEWDFKFRVGNFTELLQRIHRLGMDSIEFQKSAGVYKIIEKGKVFEGLHKEALTYLIKEKGLREKEAREALEKGGEYFYKSATFVQPMTDPYYTAQVQNLPKVPNNYYDTAPVLNPYTDPNYGKNQDIQLAMQSPDQEVFDASLVGIMAKNQNNMEKIKEDLPVLGKATHILGCRLFELWWKPENFSNDFTIDEQYDLEQSLLNTFKELGDIALMLMQRKKIYGDVQ